MKLGTRIFLCFLLIFGVSFYYPLNQASETLRVRYLEGVEEPLVDQAHILAAVIGSEMELERFDPERLQELFRRIYQQRLSARIYKLEKTGVDVRVYITDRLGRVLFDSEEPAHIGQDFSGWRDVHLTLQGKYGARATRRDENNPFSTVLYVAAPIYAHSELVGVLTVGKPTANINAFLKSAKPQIIRTGFISLVAAAVFSLGAAIWLTRPIKRLTRYAIAISQGRRPLFPRLGSGEIADLGQAFELMREAVEGRKYVEQYIQTLAHEIKSPLSAIRGAAELLRENMPEARRQRFLANIHSESERIRTVIDRMLELSAIESRKALQITEAFPFHPIPENLIHAVNAVLIRKQLTVELKLDSTIEVVGDPFLLEQAVSNLVWNAIDFSPHGGKMLLLLEAVNETTARFIVDDAGPGIPDYAREKIFDKFFSLQRPDTGRKSTGLGLNFVKEAAALHGGDIILENKPTGGARAILTFPRVAATAKNN